jgi:UPF0042 nucleotide-binding protein
LKELHKSPTLSFKKLLGKFHQVVGFFETKLVTIEKKYSKIAFSIDIREKDFLNKFFNFIEYLNSKENAGKVLKNYKILFFEADDDVLIRRFTETRRKHPLTNDKNCLLIKNIRMEKKLLQNIRKIANKIIDTSQLSSNRLKEMIKSYFSDISSTDKSIMINLISFGFKYGVPINLDMMFDVRFLPNPYYFDDMKNLTGNDKSVQIYVLEKEATKIFLKKLENFLEFLLPEFIKEGKNYLDIGIGCTGGKHRSVSIINELYRYLKKRYKNMYIGILHRDVEK